MTHYRPSNPYEIAFKAYHKEPPGVPWHSMVSAHLDCKGAFVISSPDVFIAARYVGEGWNDEGLTSVTDHRFTKLPGGMIDYPTSSMHVYCMAGDLRRCLGCLPPDVTTLSFQRRGYRVHRIKTDRLARLVQV